MVSSRGDGFSKMFVGRLLSWPPKNWGRNDAEMTDGHILVKWVVTNNGWNLLIVSQSQQPKLSILEVDMASFLKSHWEVMKTICMKDFCRAGNISRKSVYFVSLIFAKMASHQLISCKWEFCLGANDQNSSACCTKVMICSQGYIPGLLAVGETHICLYWICNLQAGKAININTSYLCFLIISSYLSHPKR